MEGSISQQSIFTADVIKCSQIIFEEMNYNRKETGIQIHSGIDSFSLRYGIDSQYM